MNAREVTGYMGRPIVIAPVDVRVSFWIILVLALGFGSVAAAIRENTRACEVQP